MKNIPAGFRNEKRMKKGFDLISYIFVPLLIFLVGFQVYVNPLIIQDSSFLIAIATVIYVIFTYLLLKHEITKHHKERFAVLDTKISEGTLLGKVEFNCRNISDKIAKNLSINFYLFNKRTKRVDYLFESKQARLIPDNNLIVDLWEDLIKQFKRDISYRILIIGVEFENDISTEVFKDVIYNYHISINSKNSAFDTTKVSLEVLNTDNSKSYNIGKLRKDYFNRFKDILKYE